MDTKVESSIAGGDIEELTKEEAVQQLMILYGNSILHLCFTYVKDRNAAEDLAQEAFLKCFEKYNQFQGQSSLKTWLFRIAVNLCKDYVRSWHYRKLKYNLADILTGRKAPKRDSVVESEVFTHYERDNLSQQVMDLPLKYREVILLHYYEELSVREISHILKTGEPTIRTRLRRGREMLRSAFSGKGEEQ